MTLPSTSVVICSRNRPAFLQDAVDSLLAGDLLPDELLVVDQSDRAHERLTALGRDGASVVRYAWEPGQGVSRARNRGLELSRSAVVAFLDDDVFVERDWLRTMATVLAEVGERTIVTGKVLSQSPETPGGWAPALVASETPATYEGTIARDVLEAGNMAGFRRTLVEVGGFDPSLGPGTPFPAGEDNDFGLRLLMAECRIRYEPAAVIYHRAWRGPEEYVPLRWRYGVGQGAYYAKHLWRRDRHMVRRLASLFRKHLSLAVRRSPREPRAALGHLAYLGGVMVGGARWSLGFGRSTGRLAS